jgi:hypothetical protein
MAAQPGDEQERAVPHIDDYWESLSVAAFEAEAAPGWVRFMVRVCREHPYLPPEALP